MRQPIISHVRGILKASAEVSKRLMRDGKYSSSGATKRIFKRYILGRHPWIVLSVGIFAAILGMHVYVYPTVARYIADDIVQIGMLTQVNTDPAPSVHTSDKTIPMMHQSKRYRDSWTTRLDAKPGLTTEQKLQRLALLVAAVIIWEITRHLMATHLFFATARLTQEATFHMRNHIHEKLHQLSQPYHDAHSPGRLLTHLFSDMQAMTHCFTMLMRHIPNGFAGIIAGTIITFVIDWRLALLVMCALPAYAVAYKYFSTQMRNVNRDIRERQGRLAGHIANRISLFHVTKAFSREIRETLILARTTKPLLQRQVVSGMLNTCLAATCGIIAGTTTTMVMWISAQKCLDGTMTAGELLMFHGTAANMFQPITMIINEVAVMQRLETVCAKIVRVMDEPIAIDDPNDPLKVPDSACEIRFDHLTFQYPNTPTPAIDDLDITIPAGAKVCIMGPSGSGKSTLAKLVARFYDPTQGSILVNDQNLKRFKLTDLRNLIRYVHQEPVVFSGTIGDNIRYGSEDADQQTVVKSAQNVLIHDFISTLPAQYRSLTHERGLTLSGGQKQRVNLARALVSDPHVLVLDDCTSALDADTEAKLIDNLGNVLSDRTALLVSHRVSVALSCDIVLMLDGGKMVQMGEPDHLIKQPGPFRELYEQQLARAQHAQEGTNAA
ncbi:MAG: ABC transporter ATP-binding protein [Phycisphaeraceae bacterium JB051]